MKEMGEAGGTAVLSAKQAQKIFDKNKKCIRQIIERKISIYQPLELDEAYDGFVERIQRDEFGLLRALPETASRDEIEAHLETIIRHHLIEQAYYKLEERFVKGRLKKRLGIYDPNDIKLADVTDFVIERIERKGFKKILGFHEESQFTTFLATVVSRLLIDYWRSAGSAKKNIGKLANAVHPVETDANTADGNSAVTREISFGDLLQQEPRDPYDVAADDEYWEFLPGALGKLDTEGRLALKLKYEKGMNISLIGRTLGISRYKAEQLIEKAELFIKQEIMLQLKNKRSEQ